MEPRFIHLTKVFNKSKITINTSVIAYMEEEKIPELKKYGTRITFSNNNSVLVIENEDTILTNSK